MYWAVLPSLAVAVIDTGYVLPGVTENPAGFVFVSLNDCPGCRLFSVAVSVPVSPVTVYVTELRNLLPVFCSVMLKTVAPLVVFTMLTDSISICVLAATAPAVAKKTL